MHEVFERRSISALSMSTTISKRVEVWEDLDTNGHGPGKATLLSSDPEREAHDLVPPTIQEIDRDLFAT
jgi:hypothetical protein